jgi:HD superfamily phosphohydrolase
MKGDIMGKAFWVTLLWKQNKWHKFSVLGHTLAVCTHLLINKKYKMIPAGLLHDIGKPYVAYQDEEDILTNEYSFTNHEEISYHIIKNWKISNYTKDLVRYHYLYRGMEKAKEKGNFAKFRRLYKIWDKLSPEFKNDLKEFQKYDDLGKKSFL